MVPGAQDALIIKGIGKMKIVWLITRDSISDARYLNRGMRMIGFKVLIPDGSKINGI